MAKKTADQHKAAPPQEDTQLKDVSKSGEAYNLILEWHNDEAMRHQHGDADALRAELARRFPPEQFDLGPKGWDKGSIDNALGELRRTGKIPYKRKRRTGGGGGDDDSPGPMYAAADNREKFKAFLQSVKEARRIIEERDDVKAFREWFETIEEVAGKVGGMENLRDILDFLKD